MASTDPLLILAPHRSFTSAVCAMIGQHPQMFGLPEMNLFVTETLRNWWVSFRQATEIGAHGLLRTVAHLYFGNQNPYTIERARHFLRERLWCTTGGLFAEIGEQVQPKVLVEKSPPTSYRIEYMRRALRFFPNARFIHLLRHPRGHGESVIKALSEADQFGALPRALRELKSGKTSADSTRKTPPGSFVGLRGLLDFSTDPPTIDPQQTWFRLHTNICLFLESVPESRKLRIKGEDLMSDPGQNLKRIAEWIGLRSDPEALKMMKHPECSPFACFGPYNAHLGNDPNFLQNPTLRTHKGLTHSLKGPLSWRRDQAGFDGKVKDLARQFGYS